MRFRISILLMSLSWLLSAADPQVSAMDVTVQEFFADTGAPASVLNGISQAAQPYAVIGFEELTTESPNVTVSGHEITVGQLLQEFCKQAPQYRIADTDDPRAIDVLAADDHSPAKQLLNYRLKSLDIESDESPGMIIRYFTDYVPELQAPLRQVYEFYGGHDRIEGVLGGGIRGDQFPHFSLHRKDLTVRDALNQIAIRSLDMYRDGETDPHMLTTPSHSRVWPVGWKFTLADPSGMTFFIWCKSLIVGF